MSFEAHRGIELLTASWKPEQLFKVGVSLGRRVRLSKTWKDRHLVNITALWSTRSRKAASTPEKALKGLSSMSRRIKIQIARELLKLTLAQINNLLLREKDLKCLQKCIYLGKCLNYQRLQLRSRTQELQIAKLFLKGSRIKLAGTTQTLKFILTLSAATKRATPVRQPFQDKTLFPKRMQRIQTT